MPPANLLLPLSLNRNRILVRQHLSTALFLILAAVCCTVSPILKINVINDVILILNNVIKVNKSRRVRWVWHAASTGQMRNAYKIVRKPDENKPLKRPGYG
jgi:hypothetical protein